MIRGGQAVDYESDSDYLIMTIYLLFSICCMRWLYLGMLPEPQHDTFVYQHTLDDPWELTSR
jgi:hypothetical protein